jgi:hypothetical protein
MYGVHLFCHLREHYNRVGSRIEEDLVPATRMQSVLNLDAPISKARASVGCWVLWRGHLQTCGLMCALAHL